MSQRGDAFWLKIFAIGMTFFITVNVISFVWFPFLPWFEQREAGEEIAEQEMNADQALQDYREFRVLYNDIQSQREQVQIAYDEEEQFHETYGDDPNNWSRTAETRHGRIHERITGNRNQLENLIAEYNALSQDATSAIFKCNLPYQVDDRFVIQGPPGSDAPDQPQDVDLDGEPVNGEVPPPEECDGLPDEIQQGASSGS